LQNGVNHVCLQLEAVPDPVVLQESCIEVVLPVELNDLKCNDLDGIITSITQMNDLDSLADGKVDGVVDSAVAGSYCF
jgi:hypothetical protein